MDKSKSNKSSSLSDRMKMYEKVNTSYLMRRNPIIIRLDGRAFHTFTKDIQKPFDYILMYSMQQTARALCESIQGCKLAYTQSDEISLLITDYDSIKTEAWFDYNVQKMVSLSASSATLFFNTFFRDNVLDFLNTSNIEDAEEFFRISNIYKNKIFKATFDSRVFSIQKDDVANYFIWRQEDATRNSIQMVAQANFSHKEIQNISCNELQNKLLIEKNINWNNFSASEKRGTAIIRKNRVVNSEGLIRKKWVIDYNTPIFKKERNYIEQLV